MYGCSNCQTRYNGELELLEHRSNDTPCKNEVGLVYTALSNRLLEIERRLDLYNDEVKMSEVPSNMTGNSYIYLLREREFVNAGKNIYKLGKTKQEPYNRLKSYPKDSEWILVRQVRDCDSLERELLKIFKKKYVLKKDIGREYFEGNRHEMMNDIDICAQHQVLINI